MSSGRGGDDFGRAPRWCVRREIRRLEPARVVELLVEGGSPASQRAGETQDDEVPLELPLAVANDHLAMTGQRDRLDYERGFLAHFANDRIGQDSPGSTTPPGRRVEIQRRFARAPHHEHLAVADDGGADGQIGTLRISRAGRPRDLSFHQPVDDILRCGFVVPSELRH